MSKNQNVTNQQEVNQSIYTDATNVALGVSALAGNAATDCVAIGAGALSTANTENGTIAIGFQALQHNTSGYSNAIGYQSMQSNTTGVANDAYGYQSLQDNVSGGYNCAHGFTALMHNTSGGNNCAFGAEAMVANTTGFANTGLGYNALFANTTGIANTAIGSNCLTGITTGSWNTCLGILAGSNYANTESDNICIANGGTSGDANVIRIGTQGTGNEQQNACFIAGIVSNVQPGQSVTINATTGQLGINPEVAFNYGTSTNQAVTAGSTSTISFTAQNFDQGSNVSASTFTAPQSGIYFFSVSLDLSMAAGQTGQSILNLITTGNTFIQTQSNSVFAGASTGLTLTTITKMSSGDTAYCTLQNTSALGSTTINGLQAGNFRSIFSGYILNF